MDYYEIIGNDSRLIYHIIVGPCQAKSGFAMWAKPKWCGQWGQTSVREEGKNIDQLDYRTLNIILNPSILHKVSVFEQYTEIYLELAF